MKNADLFSAVIDADTLRRSTQRQVVALARGRRRARAVRRAVGAAAGLAVVALVWWMGLKTPGPEVRSSSPAFTVVRTQPLAPAMLRPTQTFAGSLIAGERNAGFAVIRTQSLDIPVTETRFALPAFDQWNDRQLLAAFAGRGAALVGAGTERARLIFY